MFVHTQQSNQLTPNFFGNDGRNISLKMKLQIIFKHTLMLIGVIFTILSLFMFIIFGLQVSFEDYKFDENSPITEGKIIKVLKTNAKENNISVVKYEYEYNINSQTYKAESYTTGKQYVEQQTVEIQYIESEPQISRIENTRKGAFDPWFLLFFTPFLFVGGSMVGVGIYLSLNSIKLLKFGEIAYGILVDKQPTNVKINNKTVYKLFFEFQARDGQKYTTIAKTHRPALLENEVKEKLVYDPNNPSKAVVIDTLPQIVKDYFNNIL